MEEGEFFKIYRQGNSPCLYSISGIILIAKATELSRTKIHAGVNNLCLGQNYRFAVKLLYRRDYRLKNPRKSQKDNSWITQEKRRTKI